jgi:hypothetical protein
MTLSTRTAIAVKKGTRFLRIQVIPRWTAADGDPSVCRAPVVCKAMAVIFRACASHSKPMKMSRVWQGGKAPGDAKIHEPA